MPQLLSNNKILDLSRSFKYLLKMKGFNKDIFCQVGIIAESHCFNFAITSLDTSYYALGYHHQNREVVHDKKSNRKMLSICQA